MTEIYAFLNILKYLLCLDKKIKLQWRSTKVMKVWINFAYTDLWPTFAAALAAVMQLTPEH